MQIEDLIRQQGGADCSVPEYLRTMACVHLETGRRVMPRYIDDEVFRAAADQIEQLEAALWKQGAEILSLHQELAEAREALAPFGGSDMIGRYDLGNADENTCVCGVSDFTYGDLDRARNAIRSIAEKEG